MSITICILHDILQHVTRTSSSGARSKSVSSVLTTSSSITKLSETLPAHQNRSHAVYLLLLVLLNTQCHVLCHNEDSSMSKCKVETLWTNSLMMTLIARNVVLNTAVSVSRALETMQSWSWEARFGSWSWYLWSVLKDQSRIFSKRVLYLTMFFLLFLI